MENQNKKSKNGHGGRREGAGRPQTVGSTRTIAIRIPEDIARILDEKANKSAYIIEAIRAYERENSNI